MSIKGTTKARAHSLILNQVVPTLFVPRNGSELWGGSHRIDRGTMWQFIGPSGSGKTSLFNFLAGTSFSYKGSLLIDGLYNNGEFRTLKEFEWCDLRTNHVSFIFQDLKLIDDLSVIENLELKQNLSTASRQSDELTIGQLAHEMEIDALLHKKPLALSRGERQRVAILRSLLQDFDFLILDEPFSHLDRRLAEIVTNILVRAVRQRDAGLIMLDLGEHDLLPWDGRVYLSGHTS